MYKGYSVRLIPTLDQIMTSQMEHFMGHVVKKLGTGSSD